HKPVAPPWRRMRYLGAVALSGLLLASLGGCVPGATSGGTTSTSRPASPITEFPLSGAIQQPSGITRDASGTLWFTGQAPTSAGIGRITPGNPPQITVAFPLAPGDHPEGIASGSDGVLWFAESEHAQIGRIAPSGEITYTFVTGRNAPGDLFGSTPLGIAL